jgi:hypothetical protein
MTQLSRRGFIHAGGLVVLGTAVACARGNSGNDGTYAGVLDGRPLSLTVVVPPFELLSGRAERLFFALIDPETQAPVTGAQGSVWFARSKEGEAFGPFEFRQIGGGIEQRASYATTLSLPEDGVWLFLVDATVNGVGKVGEAPMTAGQKNDMPKPSEEAIVVATPTVRKPRGVDPICTRNPQCSMHEVSLDEALKSGRPTVVTIGTPAFCQSRFCGPVVDNVEAVSTEFPDVNFVHIELLIDDDAETVQAYQGAPPEGFRGPVLAPAAQAWKVVEEPVTYYIDGDGVIVDRHTNAIDTTDVRQGVEQIT